MFQFGTDIVVYLVKPDLSYKRITISELLPMSFSDKQLNQQKVQL